MNKEAVSQNNCMVIPTTGGRVCSVGVTKRGTTAFTLIELLVVVLIIGILTAVAIPQYQKAVEKSRVTEAVTMLSSLEQAVSLYVLEKGWVPAQTKRPGKNTGRYSFFLGDKATEAGALNIDLSSLNCNTQYGDKCASKHFLYSIDLLSENGRMGSIIGPAISITAYRILNGDEDDITYALTVFIQQDGTVKRVCFYETDEERNICESLQPQGWESDEW